MTPDPRAPSETPRCDKCGCKITTGLMAVFCPKGADCEFYPEEPELQEFIEELRRGRDYKG